MLCRRTGLQQHRETDGPALRSLQRGTHVTRVEFLTQACCCQQHGLRFVETQVPSRELADLGVYPPACERQGRFVPCAEHECDVLRQSFDQGFQQFENITVVEPMQVIEDDDDPRRRRRAQRIDVSGECCASLATIAIDASEQSRNVQVPGEAEWLDGLHERCVEPVRVIVVVVDRDPQHGAGPAECCAELRQQGALARAGRGTDQRDGIRFHGMTQAGEQLRAGDGIPPQSWHAEFGQGHGAACRIAFARCRLHGIV